MSEFTYSDLVKEAFLARKNAYTPYSKFKVGAALVTKDGKLYRGCNIENAAFSPTVCAERTAFFKAISEGVKDFEMIAIVGGDESEDDELSGYAFPCGVCRQVMNEFCSKDFKIIVGKSSTDFKVFTLNDILPYGFGPENL